MGRYYNGDIDGKFWFGVQSSNDADFFGATGCEPNYIEYDFDKDEHLIDLKERGLDGVCDSTEGGHHKWLLIPRDEIQKQYLFCMKCYESSHL